jgi:hypothetical protein
VVFWFGLIVKRYLLYGDTFITEIVVMRIKLLEDEIQPVCLFPLCVCEYSFVGNGRYARIINRRTVTSDHRSTESNPFSAAILQDGSKFEVLVRVLKNT